MEIDRRAAYAVRAHIAAKLEAHMTPVTLAKAVCGLIVLTGLVAFVPRAAAADFGPADFKGTYVATFQGNTSPPGLVPFFGRVYLDADGNGGVTGSWDVVTPFGGSNGDLTAVHAAYSVTLQGEVTFDLRSTLADNILTVNVFLAGGRQAILGRGSFLLGGGGAGGVGTIRGAKQ